MSLLTQAALKIFKKSRFEENLPGRAQGELVIKKIVDMNRFSNLTKLVSKCFGYGVCVCHKKMVRGSKKSCALAAQESVTFPDTTLN